MMGLFWEYRKRHQLMRQEQRLIVYAYLCSEITSGNASKLLGVKQRRTRDILSGLVKKGILLKQGSYRDTVYKLNGQLVFN